MSAQDVALDIRRTFFRWYQRRDRLVAMNEVEAGVLLHALEDLASLGDPDFYETVEMGGEPCIVVVIHGGTHLVTQEGAEATVVSVDLSGGRYVEVQRAVNNELELVGTYDHSELSDPLIIKIDNWEDRARIAGAREFFRRLSYGGQGRETA